MKDIWKEILDIAGKSNFNIKIIEGNKELGAKECEKMNIPCESVLFSVISNTKGIIIDNWIRILGQDSTNNRGVQHYNEQFKNDITGLFIVANDIIGGIFALNISRFDESRNCIWYFAPDALEWESMDMKYNEFLAWCMQGDVDEFYSTMRWANWKEDVKTVSKESAILIYPFLWSKECEIEKASKKAVDIDELIGINFEYYAKFS